MIKLYPSFKNYLFILLFAFIFTDCGIWEDFTTYFNLYYNTKDKFQQAEDAIAEQRKTLFEYEQPNISGNVTQLLNSVIEKSSKILQFHSNSSYVDNALIMLGKSFYYQKDYLKALRKFQELLITHPESGLILENELWIAKTQMRLKNYTDALPRLKNVRELAIEEGEDEIVKGAFVEEIVYQILQENYPSAISLINEFLDVSQSNEVNAEVMYELGRLYIKTNDINNAITSFEKVFEYSPSFTAELNTKLELSSALREIGENERALSILEDMRDEDKYSDSFDKIDLEIGVTYYNLGRIDESVDLLMKVDTVYTSSANSGIAKYKLGEIFENYYRNFDSASYFYNRSATSSNSPEYLKLATEKSQLFKKYQSIRKNISDAQKQLFYAENPEAFTQDSIAFYSDTLDTEENEQAPSEIIERRGRNERGLIQTEKTQVKTEPKNPPVRPTISVDSINNTIVKNQYDLANLFFTELNVPDSAYYYYEVVIDNYPQSSYYPQSLYSLGTYYNSIDKKEKADSIFNFIYENYKSENVVNAAAVQLNKPLINLNYDPADEIYANAEKQLLEKNYSESVKTFYNIFNKYPKSPLAAKALYACGWILENELDLLDSAAVFYDSLNVKYPQSVYASSIRSKLTFYKQEMDRKKKAIEDSLKQIELEKSEKLKADSTQKTVKPLEITKEVQNGIDNKENTKSDEAPGKEISIPDSLINLKEPEKPDSNIVR